MKAQIFGLGLLALSAPAWTAPPVQATLDQRLQRIERMLRNQSLSDIMLQLQRLQQEVQQLRGELEIQAHAIESIKKRQRDLYLDIDNRLSQMKAPAAEAGASDTTPPPVPAAAAKTPPAAVAKSPATAEKAASTKPSGGTQPPAAEKGGEGGEESAYQQAFNLLRQGRYGEAINAFKAFRKRYPSGSFADNAQYWLAEAHYVNQDFKAALEAFSKVVDEYGASPKVPGAMLKIGYVHQELGQKGKAQEIFKRLLKEYPDSSEARLAKKRLAAINKR
ncbi:MAG TPA: tol-pal system protein YbgF [Chromatiales bacterium]|nr:tol-pal system protein YbgF [Chromatiales bacterium]